LLSSSDRAERRRTPKSITPLEKRFADEARFIKSWFENPVTTGAVSPSSPFLARAMAAQIDLSLPGQIIELGPGTGPVTQALIRRGVAPERLVLVEFDAGFCRLLERRFPKAQVVHGDAYVLGKTLRNVLDGPVAAVVSGLPLLNTPETRRLALLTEAFRLMHPRGVFVQFTYGVMSPIPLRKKTGRRTGFEAASSAPIWLNLPPARIWTYRRPGAQAPRPPSPAEILLTKIKLRTHRVRKGLKEQSVRIGADLRACALRKPRRPVRANSYAVQRDPGSVGLSMFDWPGGPR
jgi:phosphatidylethanolamine/phosphatidyl-N-methylethanolamine N-methyltransferase